MQGLITAIAMANGKHSNPVASDHYVRSFLKRHPELTEIKSANVGYHRAKQATKEVRDAVFDKLQVGCMHACMYIILTSHSLTRKFVHTTYFMIGAVGQVGCIGSTDSIRKRLRAGQDDMVL